MQNTPSWYVAVPLLLLLGGVIHPCVSLAEEESGTFNFLWENDVIAGTDRHYTNGFEFSYLSIEDHLWDWFRSGSAMLPGVSGEDHLRVGLSLGQSIFTPDDTEAVQPLPDQRPYAGWLYAGVAIVANHGDQLDTWAVNSRTRTSSAVASSKGRTSRIGSGPWDSRSGSESRDRPGSECCGRPHALLPVARSETSR
jgi:hypothetical protein